MTKTTPAKAISNGQPQQRRPQHRQPQQTNKNTYKKLQIKQPKSRNTKKGELILLLGFLFFLNQALRSRINFKVQNL